VERGLNRAETFAIGRIASLGKNTGKDMSMIIAKRIAISIKLMKQLN
jgi:hypothetical protein